MNLVLLIVAIGLSALFVILLIFSIFYSAYLQRQRDHSEEEGPVDLTNENGEIDPIKQIKHLKKTTAEFGIKYEELKFGKLLGKGSQGEVFKAHWRGSTVAVKKVDTRKVPPEIIEEFAQEAQIMRRLRHPCLTLFMGVSLEHPHLCILTELVARGSLFDIIHDEHAALTWNRCIGIAIDVARGLTYLHAHSPPILHRDLKSLNILVDENWKGKVADFGMTRFQEDGTMTQCGSPLWMSPEMIRNDAYGEGSDVYSFSIILWEMYTRKIPYRELGLNPSHLVVKVVKEHLRPPIPKQCPKPYRQLMERCWNPAPEKRPTFAQILKTLESFANDPTIMNHKPMSSRDSTIIVRPERVEGEDGNGGLLGGLNGLLHQTLGGLHASGDKNWKVDASQVQFYNASGASFKDLVDTGLEMPLASPSAPRAGARNERAKSVHNLNLDLTPVTPQPTTTTTAGGNMKYGQPSPSVNSPLSEIELPVSPSPPPPVVTKEKSLGGKKTSSSTSKSQLSTNLNPLASPSIQAASPLNPHTKTAKDEELAAAAGDTKRLASQGAGAIHGRFRGKIVAIKPSYVSRSHIVLSNEERVAADLDGGVQESKLGVLMKKISDLRHPNITLFLGAYIESVDHLKKKLKESGIQEQQQQQQQSPPGHVTSGAPVTPVPGSKIDAPSTFTMPPPPPGCDYYLGMLTEFMPRGTLHDILCDSSLVVDWDTMMNLLIDAASGMTYLHGGASPVIHQDFSSHRLLVDKNWRVKVNDFGFVDLQAALTGTALPATPWSSPEYIKNPNMTNLNQASNVYSFALVMWQALARRPLWENRHLTKELSDKIVKQGDRPPLPNSLMVQKDLNVLIEKCWMAIPHARPTFATILEELNRIKKLGPPKIELKAGVNAHKYRKAKTVVAYRSKDPVTIMKDWGTNIGKKNCIIIFSGEDDVYLCDEEVFKATYEKIEPGAALGDEGLGATTAGKQTNKDILTPSTGEQFSDHHEYRKTGTVLARCMEDAFSVKTNGGTEHGMSGDYLVQNEGEGQLDQWSVERGVFEQLYERWD